MKLNVNVAGKAPNGTMRRRTQGQFSTPGKRGARASRRGLKSQRLSIPGPSPSSRPAIVTTSILITPELHPRATFCGRDLKVRYFLLTHPPYLRQISSSRFLWRPDREEQRAD